MENTVYNSVFGLTEMELDDIRHFHDYPEITKKMEELNETYRKYKENNPKENLHS